MTRFFRTARFSRAHILLSLPLLLSCGGGTEPTGPPAYVPMQRVVEATPVFDVIQELVERNGCTGASCHLSGQGELYLGPDPQVNYANLVAVRAYSEPGFFRVDPGNADESYVIIKVEGRQRVGGAMPLGGPLLDSIDMANLRNWIESGAPEP